MITVGKLLAVLLDHPESPVHLMLPDLSFVPGHFHVTEVGRVQKEFVDCGGVRRSTETCVLQVWVADDIDHRLSTSKLVRILELGGSLFKDQAVPVEVEYERGLISQYPIVAAEPTPGGILFHLGSKHTACLAPDSCGVSPESSSCCSTSGCC